MSLGEWNSPANAVCENPNTISKSSKRFSSSPHFSILFSQPKPDEARPLFRTSNRQSPCALIGPLCSPPGAVLPADVSQMLKLSTSEGRPKNVEEKKVLPYDRPKKIIRETEYQEEYRNEDILNGVNILKKRFIPAGLPSKGKPEYEPEEYDSSDGILPDFRGKSTVKSAYVPQPNLQKLSSCKPPSVTKSPFLLQPHMTEVQPYSHSVYCPMPRELVQQTAPTKPLWNVDNLKPLVCGTRYDLTSSYQADYCGTQTQPRKICLEKNSESKLINTDFTKSHKEYSSEQNPKCKANKDETQQWNYAHSLLFRTTYNTDYLPPSTHGLFVIQPCIIPMKNSF